MNSEFKISKSYNGIVIEKDETKSSNQRKLSLFNKKINTKL